MADGQWGASLRKTLALFSFHLLSASAFPRAQSKCGHVAPKLFRGRGFVNLRRDGEGVLRDTRHFPKRGGVRAIGKGVQEKPIKYLDHATTYEIAEKALDAMDHYFATDNANVHRGAHALAARATEGYEGARAKIAQLINANEPQEVVFTRSATEAINLLASTWGDKNINEGDEIILSVQEHHSNILPWQHLARRKKAKITYIGLNRDYEYDLNQLREALSEKTKLVGICHASNVLGTLNPIPEITSMAREFGAVTLIDAAQTMSRSVVDVKSLGCDFLVGSGHKMMGPMGIGFLWGEYKLLEEMPPWQGGGEMIDEVFLERSTYALPPGRFEAGTPAIAESIGIGAAVDVLVEIGPENVLEKERELGCRLFERLSTIPNLHILGGPKGRLGVCSFTCDKFSDPNKFAEKILMKGFRVASGFHEAEPLHRYLGATQGSVRVSFKIGDRPEDVDAFVDAIRNLCE